jgi:2-phospho-L-lactate guanylyltransferase (CobY/MobA/RfbA family)
MADCPLVTAEALDRLAAAAEPVALAPAQDGGLNALAVREPNAFEPAFGVEGAAAETAARAEAAGLEPAVVADPALAFDVDRPADVWRLRLREDDGAAAESHRVLAAILPPTGGLL